MTSDVIATGKKFRKQFAIKEKLILYEHILLSSILENNRVIVIENRPEKFSITVTIIDF